MKTWILDTNLLIYLLTGHPQFAARARAMLEEAQQKDHTLFIPVAVVAEILYVLEGESFGYTPEEATRALEQLIVTEGIDCQDATAVLYGLERHREANLDFVDGYCAALAMEMGALLITNDRALPRKTDATIRLL